MPLPAFLVPGAIKAFAKNYQIVLILGVLALISFFAWRTVSNIQEASYKAGVDATELKWLAIEQKRQEAYDLEVRRLSELVAVTEAKLAKDLEVVEDTTKQQLQEVIDEKETTIAKLRDGNLRLSIELRRTAAEAATAELAGTTAVRYATYRAELSEEASEFLIGFAADADGAAVRLGQCQQTIRTYLNAVEDYNRKYTTYSF